MNANFQKTSNQNFDMRHRPNESAHTQIPNADRHSAALVVLFQDRTKKNRPRLKFMVFASPEERL